MASPLEDDITPVAAQILSLVVRFAPRRAQRNCAAALL